MNDADRINSLKDKIKNQRNITGINTTVLLKKYFIDGFLFLLSKSPYKDNFIWKGGFILSAITGIEKRTTVDIDTLIHDVKLSEKELSVVMNEITRDKFEGTKYDIKAIHPIQEDKNYTGLRITIKATLGNMSDDFHLDITTGEIILPKEIAFTYQSSLLKKKISLLIYPPERMLAEKLQTIISRGLANSRMKDFYDCYILNSHELIDDRKLIIAFDNIIKERNSVNDWENWKSTLQSISHSKFMQNSWVSFQNKNHFASQITWNTVLQSISNEFELLNTES
ncbi:nucleotidyl transferase AbiEii/AbiGii toxin family protein [Companilactobacillus allii]|uniref:Abortive infection protein n=1 Tax=Companilactobacillus allii TaxID=1847728 RepID=A0A1P8Q1H9_9LACO|nr:nucleotidyl transferase AbiEii/AbiGii toxin family protein [Companilactobacillus allii]APX71734.1 abortive infection protein [Companilactobacillus allii]USQ68821.1 nucleotidyl transferase AbiEii/AbiGii toxin family protein [Companilactobacillus allii]